MIHGCVTLDEVFAAAGARAASLVPETSGYLALAVGDATSRLPFAIDERLVMLTTEGNVGITKRGEILPPRHAAQGLRAILARLLTVATGTAMPSLSAAARPREESDRGVDAVVEAIEAALIPVNRAAARRALARLARETIKARENGRLKRQSARPPAEAPRAAAPPKPEPVVVPAPAAVAALPAPVVAPPAPVAALPAPVAPEPVVAQPAPVAALPASVGALPAPVAPPEPVVAQPALVVALPAAVAQPVPMVVPPAPVVAQPAPIAPPVPVVVPPAPVVAQPVPVVAQPVPVITWPPEPAIVALEWVMAPPEAVVSPPEPVVAAPETEHVAIETTTPPPEEPHDPTPTVLGMATVEMHEAELYAAIDVATEDCQAGLELAAPAFAEEPAAVEPATAAPATEPAAAPATQPAAPAEQPTAAPATEPAAPAEQLAAAPAEQLAAAEPATDPAALPESTVLAQPTEDPTLAFELVRRVDRPLQAITPPFAFEVAPAPRTLSAAQPTAREARLHAGHAGQACTPAPRDARPTRADDLLARFGASCVDEQGMREAAACLRRIAGIEPTAPPARVELRLPAAPRPAPAPTFALSSDWETPRTPRVKARRGSGLGLSLMVLVAGLAAGGAVVRFRPDLLGALGAPVRRLAPALLPPTPVAKPAPPDKEAPAPPATTVEPTGAAVPSWSERPGAPRAERGSVQRAR